MGSRIFKANPPKNEQSFSPIQDVFHLDEVVEGGDVIFS